MGLLAGEGGIIVTVVTPGEARRRCYAIPNRRLYYGTEIKVSLSHVDRDKNWGIQGSEKGTVASLGEREGKASLNCR